MENNAAKKSNKGLVVGLIIAIVLVIITLVSNIAVVIQESTDTRTMAGISIANALFVLVYMFYEYKVPHGNMLRYVMLAFALNLGLFGMMYYKAEGNHFISTLYIVLSLAVAFMSGRLGKLKKNKILSIVILALLAVGFALKFINMEEGLSIFRGISSASEIAEWLAIATVYLVRFDAHKESGNTVGQQE